MFGTETAWEGVVESFALTGHPKAKRCYAWSFKDGGEMRYLGVLELPPVESPQTAVRVAIASGAHATVMGIVFRKQIAPHQLRLHSEAQVLNRYKLSEKRLYTTEELDAIASQLFQDDYGHPFEEDDGVYWTLE